MKLSEDLEHWRAERPDEWTMDDFIRKAKELEDFIEECRDKILYPLANGTHHLRKIADGLGSETYKLLKSKKDNNG
jgi:hypothetical protein